MQISIFQLVKIYWKKITLFEKSLSFASRLRWSHFGRLFQAHFGSGQDLENLWQVKIVEMLLLRTPTNIFFAKDYDSRIDKSMLKKKGYLSTESAFHPCNCADMAKTGSLTALLASIWAHNLAGWTSSNI